MLSVYRNGPTPLQPQWATRSIPRNPGRASVQPAKVRMAIWRLSSVPALVVLRPRRFLLLEHFTHEYATDRAMLEAMLFGGLRRSEVLGLRGSRMPSSLESRYSRAPSVAKRHCLQP